MARRRDDFALYQNKSETIFLSPKPPPGCSYFVESERRFCDAPAVPGSSYCPAHRRLCQVRHGTDDARRLLRGFERAARGDDGALPPELAFLASIDPPELDSADEPRDLAGCIDLAPPADGGAE